MASKLRSGLGCVLLGVALACGGNDAATPEPQAQKTAEAESALPSSAPNEAPVIDSLRLEPADPQPGDRLTARVESSDPDGDAVQLSYEWRIDGTRSRDRGHSLRVDEGVSSIEVRVTASDPEGASDRDHALVYVANRPPEIVGVVIEPAGEATALRDLLASPRASDPDGDDLSYRFAWRVNGSSAGDGGPELSRRSFHRGDRVELWVVASDGQDESERFEIEPIPIVNSPPTISSTPGGFEGDEVLRYQLSATDPDGDRRFRFELMQGPDGMEVDAVTGELEWAPREDQSGTHGVEVQVSDGRGGTAAQAFEVSVAVGQQAPPGAPAPAPEAE